MVRGREVWGSVVLRGELETVLLLFFRGLAFCSWFCLFDVYFSRVDLYDFGSGFFVGYREFNFAV